MLKPIVYTNKDSQTGYTEEKAREKINLYVNLLNGQFSQENIIIVPDPREGYMIAAFEKSDLIRYTNRDSKTGYTKEEAEKKLNVVVNVLKGQFSQENIIRVPDPRGGYMIVASSNIPVEVNREFKGIEK